MTMPLYFD